MSVFNQQQYRPLTGEKLDLASQCVQRRPPTPRRLQSRQARAFGHRDADDVCNESGAVSVRRTQQCTDLCSTPCGIVLWRNTRLMRQLRDHGVKR